MIVLTRPLKPVIKDIIIGIESCEKASEGKGQILTMLVAVAARVLMALPSCAPSDIVIGCVVEPKIACRSSTSDLILCADTDGKTTFEVGGKAGRGAPITG